MTISELELASSTFSFFFCSRSFAGRIYRLSWQAGCTWQSNKIINPKVGQTKDLVCSKSVENSYLISDTRSTFAIAQTPVDTLSELVLKHCIIKIPHKSGHKLVTIDDCYMLYTSEQQLHSPWKRF